MSSIDAVKFIEFQVKAIKDSLKGEKALIAVSGGVDSTVSAVLVHKAIGENLDCVFIDDNFMRIDEPEEVKRGLSAPPLNLPVEVLEEKERFMKILKGVSDAEQKRKLFREAFYQTLSDAARVKECKFLIQGTIKADIDETKGGIKTQHNILDQIGINPMEKYGFKIIEPVASLYKNQVREVARYLDVPTESSERQPFPGPGLSVRVVGEITKEKLENLRRATSLVEEKLRNQHASQYFAAIFEGITVEAPMNLKKKSAESLGIAQKYFTVNYLSERATGILDGLRAYGLVATVQVANEKGEQIDLKFGQIEKMREAIQSNYPEITRVLYQISDKGEENGYFIVIRSVETVDFLTADVSEIPWHILKSSADEILDACPKVGKIYYDVTPKPPATIEFE